MKDTSHSPPKRHEEKALQGKYFCRVEKRIKQALGDGQSLLSEKFSSLFYSFG